MYNHLIDQDKRKKRVESLTTQSTLANLLVDQYEKIVIRPSIRTTP